MGDLLKMNYKNIWSYMYNYQPNPYMYSGSQYGNQQYYQPQTQQIQPQIGLNGKIVDSVDIVKLQEIPFGSYGVYPKADLSSIFVKQWTASGNTVIDEYTKTVTKSEETVSAVTLTDIMNSITSLEKKVDSLQKPSNVLKKKKVEEDEVE